MRESALFGLLLHLAKKRVADAKSGKLPEKEQGWMDTPDLEPALGLDDLAVNRTVCRLRQLFRRVGVQGAWDVVKRRRKQLRIGTGRLLGVVSG